ncbi:hypothetical protein BD324DRAFT_617674 [Kockovaella imperatae]|uniref:Uncharacterized protein n=1 Tax=Kockovaella imperatae TaxID=4999 RepID=A0A1Y1ULM3_9TREE|nr:hypothetical protein BD324DRAFT_617674 [Kockovaella imperatae]ORX38882.1 hypothetical protein BD324DRAFT_617674 [Kockovaella imperatae]
MLISSATLSLFCFATMRNICFRLLCFLFILLFLLCFRSICFRFVILLCFDCSALAPFDCFRATLLPSLACCSPSDGTRRDPWKRPLATAYRPSSRAVVPAPLSRLRVRSLAPQVYSG